MMGGKLYLNKNRDTDQIPLYSQWVIETRERNRDESHAMRDGGDRKETALSRVKKKNVF